MDLHEGSGLLQELRAMEVVEEHNYEGICFCCRWNGVVFRPQPFVAESNGLGSRHRRTRPGSRPPPGGSLRQSTAMMPDGEALGFNMVLIGFSMFKYGFNMF